MRTISWPRNFQRPSSMVPDLKWDAGVENPEVPGAKTSGGTAPPVTDRIWLIIPSVVGTVSDSLVELLEEM